MTEVGSIGSTGNKSSQAVQKVRKGIAEKMTLLEAFLLALAQVDVLILIAFLTGLRNLYPLADKPTVVFLVLMWCYFLYILSKVCLLCY